MDTDILNPSIDNVLDNLYIGNQAAAMSPRDMSKMSIIVNCSTHIPNYHDKSGVKYINIPVYDPGGTEDVWGKNQEIMVNKMISDVPGVYRSLKSGKHVYVHCHAGMQRSAAFVVAILMYHHVKTFGTIESRDVNDIMQYLRGRRQLVFNYGRNVNFLPALRCYLQYLAR